MAKRLIDRWGNELWCGTGTVYLRLKGSNRDRILGKVRGDMFYAFKEKKHIFGEQGDTIAFNWHLMRYGKFRNVEIRLYDGRILRTTREKILQEGVCRQFREKNFELQLFVRIAMFDEVMEEVL